MIQMGIAVIIVIVLLYYAVPQMAESFAEQGKDLPGPTQFLLSLSDFITSYFVFIIFFFIGLVALWRYIKSTPAGARRIDMLTLKVPIVGNFVRMQAIVQFSYTLGVLLEGGVNLAQSLDIVCKIIDNRILADALNEARDKIIKQGKIAQYLKQTGLFPSIAIYLISTGEETGQLDAMLLTVAKNYEAELGDLADSLSAKLGPILLIIMALVVGFIAVAMMLPMIESIGNMGTL
jgi:type II secretory pathway component PulF